MARHWIQWHTLRGLDQARCIRQLFRLCRWPKSPVRCGSGSNTLVPEVPSNCWWKRISLSPQSSDSSGNFMGDMFWPRPEGIQASIPLENFQRWSYQPSLFEAVDGGLDRRCEGGAFLGCACAKIWGDMENQPRWWYHGDILLMIINGLQ